MRFACIPDASCTMRSPLSSLVPGGSFLHSQCFLCELPHALPVRYTVRSLFPFLVHSLMHSPIVPVHFTGVPLYATSCLFSHVFFSPSMFPGLSLCIPLNWTSVLPWVLSCTPLHKTPHLPPMSSWWGASCIPVACTVLVAPCVS